MPPYQRDAGMTEGQARRLADQVRAELMGSMTVQAEGRFFVLTVETSSGTVTLRDEADWTWLRRQGISQEQVPPGSR